MNYGPFTFLPSHVCLCTALSNMKPTPATIAATQPQISHWIPQSETQLHKLFHNYSSVIIADLQVRKSFELPKQNSAHLSLLSKVTYIPSPQQIFLITILKVPQEKHNPRNSLINRYKKYRHVQQRYQLSLILLVTHCSQVIFPYMFLNRCLITVFMCRNM